MRDNIANFDPEVTQTVLRNFYVDNCLKSTNSEQEFVLVKNLIRLCAPGGFKLNKWINNSRSQEQKNLDLNQECSSNQESIKMHYPLKELLGYTGVSSPIHLFSKSIFKTSRLPEEGFCVW